MTGTQNQPPQILVRWDHPLLKDASVRAIRVCNRRPDRLRAGAGGRGAEHDLSLCQARALLRFGAFERGEVGSSSFFKSLFVRPGGDDEVEVVPGCVLVAEVEVGAETVEADADSELKGIDHQQHVLQHPPKSHGVVQLQPHPRQDKPAKQRRLRKRERERERKTERQKERASLQFIMAQAKIVKKRRDSILLCFVLKPFSAERHDGVQDDHAHHKALEGRMLRPRQIGLHQKSKKLEATRHPRQSRQNQSL